ncbi:MAG: peptidase M22 [Ruminococcaceae bacterium]|nr:peptidase M22 [Oscillospiraceae bacterium]
MKNIAIGIDTSNYTTSLCAYSAEDGVIASERKLLPVSEGSLGLRQSDAVFAHIKALPELFCALNEKLRDKAPDRRICVVGVSERPVSAEGSYMPCFLSGVAAASAAAMSADAPVVRFSHQDGHIAAGLYGDKAFDDIKAHDKKDGEFYAFHLSGGTCELVRAVKSSEAGGYYDVSTVSESLDVTCGQLIDRCGVKMGIAFPCGGELEHLAMESEKKYNVKIPCKNGNINISGIQNKFEKMIADNEPYCDVASFVFSAVSSAVLTMAENVPCGEKILFSGGVTNSVILKSRIEEKLKGKYELIFAPCGMSSDNAVGTAILAMLKYSEGIHE